MCFTYLLIVVSSYIIIPALRMDYVFGVVHKLIDDINEKVDVNIPINKAHSCVDSIEKIYIIALDFEYWIAVALNSWWFLVVLLIILFIYIKTRKDVKEITYI